MRPSRAPLVPSLRTVSGAFKNGENGAERWAGHASGRRDGTIKPRNAKELRQAVEWALNEGVTLDVRGGGSKLSLGKPMRCDQVLDLSGI